MVFLPLKRSMIMMFIDPTESLSSFV